MKKIVITIGIIICGTTLLFTTLLLSPTEEYSFATIKKQLRELSRDPTLLLFVGDIMLSRSVGKKIINANDPTFPFQKIARIIEEADLAFGNLEGPISDRGRNQGSIYSFRADPKAVQGLSYAGFDVLSLANNHIFDWGRDALEDTISLLQESNIAPIGAGKNEIEANNVYIKEIKGTKFAFLASTNLYPESLEAAGDLAGISDFGKLIEKSREAKTLADIVVVSLHWGEEYNAERSEYQRKFAEALTEAGADIIIGHHPHVVQEVEEVIGTENDSTKVIAYSLGNFVFDQNFSTSTMEGLMLKIKIEDKKIKEVEKIKVEINKDFQPQIPQA